MREAPYTQPTPICHNGNIAVGKKPDCYNVSIALNQLELTDPTSSHIQRRAELSSSMRQLVQRCHETYAAATPMMPCAAAFHEKLRAQPRSLGGNREAWSSRPRRAKGKRDGLDSRSSDFRT